MAPQDRRKIMLALGGISWHPEKLCSRRQHCNVWPQPEGSFAMTDTNPHQPTFVVVATTTTGIAIMLAATRGLLQIPEIRSACLGVLRDPDVHEACLDASRRVGLAVAKSWRTHGKGAGPALMKFLRSNWP
jgi:hypothetical protein